MKNLSQKSHRHPVPFIFLLPAFVRFVGARRRRRPTWHGIGSLQIHASSEHLRGLDQLLPWNARVVCGSASLQPLPSPSTTQAGIGVKAVPLPRPSLSFLLFRADSVRISLDHDLHLNLIVRRQLRARTIERNVAMVPCICIAGVAIASS